MKKITKLNKDDVFKVKAVSVETAELKGYELIDELFVDSSGWGAENEPAMTKSQFEKRIDELLNELGSFYACITRMGQFQAYVGIFSKTGKKRCKKIGNNTLEVMHKDGARSIRLHNTNVLTFNADGSIMLDSGGWQTSTTKSRINQYLPNKWGVVQKAYEWYLVETDNEYNEVSRVPFVDGMIIS